MTKENYTYEESEKFIDEIRSIVNSSHRGWHNKLKTRQDLLDFINYKTPLLQDGFYKLSTKVYWVLNNIVEFPCCRVDGTPFIKLNVGLHSGYPKYCSVECQWKDDECCAKRDATNNSKTPEERMDQVQKFRATCQERYHANSWQSSERGRQYYSDLHRGFSDEKKRSILEKRIATTNRIYGVDNVFQNEDIKRKCCETKKTLYGDEHYQNREQARRTMRERLGCEYTFQNPEKVAQAVETKRKIYGEHLEVIVEKMEQTCMERYGEVNYGCTEECREKMRETCTKRYGVDSFSKTDEFTKSRKKRIFHDNLYFDSNWEVKVYDYLKENHIAFEYSPSISIPYKYDGREFTYHPDFLVDGILYEVKGDQFFRIDESNHEVMVNPYRNPDWSDEQYAWVCGKYEAKHQCLIANNVTILRSKDIENLNIEMFN